MKKRSMMIIAIILLASLPLSGCDALGIGIEKVDGSGDVIVEPRDLPGFTNINVEAGVEVYLTQLNEGVEVHAESNLLKYIQTTVEDQTLHIKIQDPDGGRVVLANLEPIRIYIKTIRIRSISLSGGAELTSSQLLAEDAEINLTLTDGSEGYINAVRTDALYVSLTDGSELEIVDGDVPDQFIEASDGSYYMAEWLNSEMCELELKDGSEATVWATDTLSVNLTGGSMVYYYGSPGTIDEVRSSGGSDYVSRGDH
jgi:hypothetical protein